ncbi:MAG: DUF1844 domain-containing protein [Acidobacteria bacterium]|nr:DUF1844 domain-containing protein [Acidobacteriota bacterium]
MSEEKPTFKVTDRRLFNTDGTPRDIVREAEPATTQEPEAAVESAPAPASGTEGSEPEAAHTSAATPSSADQTVPSPTAVRGVAHAEPAPPAATPAEEEDDDPQEFLMVVEFIASFAADALGLVNHPGAVGREVNLPLAKQCIDMLGTLQKKTRNNLNAEEQQFFELILSQLRMQYVSLTSGSRGGVVSPGPRGFSGSDITGGR